MNAAMNMERYDYYVEDGKVPIPAGFAPTKIEKENSIKEGVVITDKNGNEFVWIPCIATDDERESGTDTEGNINYNQKRDPSWAKDNYEKTNATWTDPQTTEIGIPSIQKNGGFYVGRYEAGIPEEANFYPNEKNNYKYYTGTADEDGITKDTTDYVPVSKKNNPAWNFITQPNAETVSKNMIKNNSTVNSYLIDSKAWDTICRVISAKTDKSITNSSSWGNYVDNETITNGKIYSLHAIHTNNNGSPVAATNYIKGYVTDKPEGGSSGKVIELSTGVCEKFKAYNIYDFAGNMWESTTEICSDTSSTIRGVGFHNYGENGGAVKTVSIGGRNESKLCYRGFRVILYLNS